MQKDIENYVHYRLHTVFCAFPLNFCEPGTAKGAVEGSTVGRTVQRGHILNK